MGRLRCTIVLAAIGVALLPARPIAAALAASAAEATIPAPPAPDFPALESPADISEPGREPLVTTLTYRVEPRSVAILVAQ